MKGKLSKKKKDEENMEELKKKDSILKLNNNKFLSIL